MDIKDLRILDADGKRYMLVPEQPGEQRNDITALKIVPAQTAVVPAAATPAPPPRFGDLFRQRREDASITQEEIEDACGILQENISDMENGGRNPRARNQQRLIGAWEQVSGQTWE